MSLTDRDRKIVLVIVPLLLIVGYWFLLLAPKRQEAADAGQSLAKAEKRLDRAEALVAQTERAKTTFAADYAQLVRLGKAIPSSVDMPSLIVQLDSAARGTHIKFKKIGSSAPAGGAAAASAAAAPQPSGSGGGTQPAAAGGQAAQSEPGKATESANTAAQAANSSSTASNAQSSGVDAKDTQTSTSTRQGLPVGGGASSAPQAGGGQGGGCAAGLVCVPLTMEFTGGFFDLTDFFHRLKRFVKVADQDLKVNGRLMTIDTLKFASDAESFPGLKAEIGATVYLAPKTEGTTAGATPQGPATTTPAGGQPPAAGAAPTTPTSTPAPAGSATP